MTPHDQQRFAALVGWRRARRSSYDPRMTNPMTKILLALLTLAMMTGAALAQQRTFYGAGGKVGGRSATDSSGMVTNYDARGKVISRETTTGNTTTIYDAGGRNVGRVTMNR
jgi:YD repeat-containing protein